MLLSRKQVECIYNFSDGFALSISEAYDGRDKISNAIDIERIPDGIRIRISAGGKVEPLKRRARQLKYESR